jgi:Uma2 family endonuclease
MPLAAVVSAPARMSGAEFRSFQERRPDHERWELVGGVPVMMTPPLMEHNRIATNLENLLNAALRDHDPARIAVQRAGIEAPWPDAIVAELGKGGEYRPEPDVAVVNYDEAVGGARFTSVAYLLAEVISATDEDLTPHGAARWIDVKVRLYQSHAPCEAILLVEQEQVHVTLFARGPQGWQRQDLTGMDDAVDLPSMGLSCTVGDLYADTRWSPRSTQARRLSGA